MLSNRVYRQVPAPPRFGLYAFIGSLLLTAMVGCGSTRPGMDSSVTREISYEQTPHQVDQRLRSEVARWKGTPHRWGGTSRSGIDCSGFVMVLYQGLFGLALPRATETQVLVGTSQQRQDLQPGDLVFFRPGKGRHVGIYLSDGEFAHASSSAGVTVSHLDQDYWHSAYWTARRVLTLSPEPEGLGPRPSLPSSDPPPRPSSSASTRTSTGW